MFTSSETGRQIDHMFVVQDDVATAQVCEKALIRAIKQSAIDGMDWDFDRALRAYCTAWATANNLVKAPEPDGFGSEEETHADEMMDSWASVSNEAQTDPEISSLRRDLNFIARHLCITLPSTKDEENDDEWF